MIRTLAVSFAFLAAVVQFPSDAWSQEPLGQVVPKVTLRSPSNKENPIFADVGDVLIVLEKKQRTLLVQTPTGRRGNVGTSDVVDLKASRPIYDRLIREEPDNPLNYSSRALVWNLNEDKHRELADLNQAIKLGLKSPSVYINRGTALATNGKYDQAVADYNQAIKLGYVAPAVYMNRAVAYSASGQRQYAVDDFTRVIKAEPNNQVALLQRGIAQQGLQKWDAAIADFTALLKLDPKHEQALSSRGFTHYLKGDPKQAVADFSALIKLNPKSAMAYNNRGYNRQMISEYAEAIEDFDKAAELEPKYALAFQNKAWLLATCPDEKIRDGKTAIQAATTAGELREWKAIPDIKSLAAAYAEVGDFDKAVQWQQKAIDLAEGEGKSGEEELLKLYKAKAPFRFSPPAPVAPIPEAPK